MKPNPVITHNHIRILLSRINDVKACLHSADYEPLLLNEKRINVHVISSTDDIAFITKTLADISRQSIIGLSTYRTPNSRCKLISEKPLHTIFKASTNYLPPNTVLPLFLQSLEKALTLIYGGKRINISHCLLSVLRSCDSIMVGICTTYE